MMPTGLPGGSNQWEYIMYINTMLAHRTCITLVSFPTDHTYYTYTGDLILTLAFEPWQLHTGHTLPWLKCNINML